MKKLKLIASYVHLIKQNGISGKLLNLIKDFLKNRNQRVVLNGQFSSWGDVDAGVDVNV